MFAYIVDKLFKTAEQFSVVNVCQIVQSDHYVYLGSVFSCGSFRNTALLIIFRQDKGIEVIKPYRIGQQHIFRIGILVVGKS